MNKILASDGIQLKVGDVVTKAETTPERKWAFGLAEGIVTAISSEWEGDTPLCIVHFKQVTGENDAEEGEEYYCRVCDLLHIGAENTYDWFSEEILYDFLGISNKSI